MIKNKQQGDTNFLAILSAVLIVVLAITVYLGKMYKSEALEYSKSISSLQKQSKSTDIESIEADLDATDLSDLDQELKDIEKELDATDLE